MTYAIDISPHVLRDGEWVLGKGRVMRWVPDSPFWARIRAELEDSWGSDE